MNVDFMENNEGVHAMSPANSEYSLCGDAFDIGSEINDTCENMRATKRRSVSCPKCATILRALRGIRISATLKEIAS